MIIWIASYPKSGNTWVRSFLSSYIYGNGKSFEFSDLNKIRAFPSDPEINFLKKKYGNYNFINMAQHWDYFQKDIIKKNKFTFLKTHNALVSIKENSFTSLENSLGLIYIVRDPRDVIISYSSHLNISLDETANHLTNANLIEKTSELFDRSLITNWSNHYNSWKNFPIKKIIIKYEDLLEKPEFTFLKILEYLNGIIELKINKKLIQDTVENVKFDKLKKLELDKGFFENKSPNKNHLFFKEGKRKQWTEKLPTDLKEKIEKSFKSELLENRYI